MFDFAWSEIVLIAAVALIAIGPKDMPVALRTISGLIKKARRMAGEFQTHVDEMMREADLGDVRKTVSEIRNFDIHSAVEKAVDPDRSLRKTFEANPLEPTYPTPAEVSTLDEVAASAPIVAISPNADLSESEHMQATRGDATRSTVEDTRENAAGAAAETVTAQGRQSPQPTRPAAPAWIPPDLVPPPAIEAAMPSDQAPAFIPPDAVQQRRARQ